MTKNGVSALKGTSKTLGFTKEKSAIYNEIKLGFCAIRSASVHSIAIIVLERTRFPWHNK
jgi:hypothetical protein